MSGPETVSGATAALVVIIGLVGFSLMLALNSAAKRRETRRARRSAAGQTLACGESALWFVIGLLALTAIGGGTLFAAMAAILGQP